MLDKVNADAHVIAIDSSDTVEAAVASVKTLDGFLADIDRRVFRFAEAGPWLRSNAMKRPMKRRPSLILLSLLLLASPGLVLAQTSDPASTTTTATALPAWDNITSAQHDLLIAPIRERWNTNPDSRARIYQHAQRWQQMPPGQRERACHGMRRWELMDPEKRTEMRALFHQMRGMTPEQRDALREQWRGMSDAQRRAWVQAHPPGRD